MSTFLSIFIPLWILGFIFQVLADLRGGALEYIRDSSERYSMNFWLLTSLFLLTGFLVWPFKLYFRIQKWYEIGRALEIADKLENQDRRNRG